MTDPQSPSTGHTMGPLGFGLCGSGAMLAMMQGEPWRAVDLLDALTPEQRARVATAARELAELAEQA